LSIVTLFLGMIAGISLLVGGIGVMNIMIVSVTERTREIGLRKAVGAKYGNLLLQFLFESVTLCLIGGFLGVALGGVVTVIGSNFLPKPGAFCPKDQWSSHFLPTSPLTTGAFRAIIVTDASLYKLAW